MQVSSVHLCRKAQDPILHIWRHFVGHFGGHIESEMYRKCVFNILGLVCVLCVCFLNWKLFIKINDYTIWWFGRHLGRHLEYLKMPKGDKVAPGIFLKLHDLLYKIKWRKTLETTITGPLKILPDEHARITGRLNFALGVRARRLLRSQGEVLPHFAL